MISKTTDRFWRDYSLLPPSIRKHAKEAYRLFLKDPYYPSLHFKRIHSARSIYSVRITKEYRAIGLQIENEIIWFWIGSHSDYDKIIKEIRNA